MKIIEATIYFDVETGNEPHRTIVFSQGIPYDLGQVWERAHVYGLILTGMTAHVTNYVEIFTKGLIDICSAQEYFLSPAPPAFTDGVTIEQYLLAIRILGNIIEAMHRFPLAMISFHTKELTNAE